MGELETIRGGFVESSKDTKLNLQSVLQPGTLSASQVWGTAIASAFATRNARLVKAVLADASAHVDANVMSDAQAAASLMAMNNVYYRFRHMVGKESYGTKPARLRMNWMAKPLGSKADFELYCLAVSAINGCEMCIRSHEETLRSSGVSEDQIHDAVRIASVLQASAVSLEISELASPMSAASA